jgi:cytoskeletal protein CcmA (bactofilin family)
VVSETKIIVGTSAVLNDIVLMAPEIEIKDYVEGAFQALANKNIAVGKQCRLHYPSALVLVPKKESNDDELNSPITTKQIDIGDGSEITGTVIFYGKTKPNNFNPQLIIRKESIVKGEVYCSSNLELKGRVYGTVFTSDFVAKESGSIYQNHIYNGNIIIKELPAQYVGISFEASNKGIIKWLY